MSKKIIGVLGLGVFGRTVATELSRFKQDVIALDNNEALVQEIADMVSKAAIGDITDIEFLKAVGIDQCDTVVVATGSNLEASVLSVMHCKKLGVPTILAKAKNETFEEVLYGIGATKVITPERDSGKAVASNMLRHYIENIIHLKEHIDMIEFTVPESWVGKTIEQLDIRKKYGLNLIAIRKGNLLNLDTSINPNEPFEPNTDIVAISTDGNFEKFDYLGYLK